MAKITYETDHGTKVNLKIDEKLIDECDAMGIQIFQEVLNVVREEIKSEENTSHEHN